MECPCLQPVACRASFLFRVLQMTQGEKSKIKKIVMTVVAYTDPMLPVETNFIQKWLIKNFRNRPTNCAPPLLLYLFIFSYLAITISIYMH